MVQNGPLVSNKVFEVDYHYISYLLNIYKYTVYNMNISCGIIFELIK